MPKGYFTIATLALFAAICSAAYVDTHNPSTVYAMAGHPAIAATLRPRAFHRTPAVRFASHIDESLSYNTRAKRECLAHGFDFVGSDTVYTAPDGKAFIECGRIIDPGQSIEISRVRFGGLRP
jgi:hypothetical protein